MKFAANITEAIGNTPLVKLNKLPEQWGVRAQILVKIGYMNPGGSYKDRIGLQMLTDAEESGELEPGGTIVECTSGNTGMGLALAAVAKGYRCVFVMPDKMSREKIDSLRALGAEVIVTPTAVERDDPRSYYSVAARIKEETPNAWHANQYFNQSNPRAHYNSTGPEIWRDTEGKVSVFVNGMGTGGTLTGVGKYLKEQNPNVKIVGVDPIGSMYYDKFHRGVDIKPDTYLVEGIGEDFYPETMDMAILDDCLQITDIQCFTTARKLARFEGIFSGGSTGAAVWGALEYAKRNDLGPEAVIVVPACDHGMRYLSKVFSEQWLRENSMLESEYSLAAEQLLQRKRTNMKTITIAPTATADEALHLVKEFDVSQLPVVEDGEAKGSVREAALVELFVKHTDPKSVTVADIMSDPFPVVDANTPLEDVAGLLTKQNPAVLVRGTDGELGIITKYDLISHIAR